MKTFLQILSALPLVAILAHWSVTTSPVAAIMLNVQPMVTEHAVANQVASLGTETGNWVTIEPTSGSPTPRHETGFVQAGNKFYLMGGRGDKAVELFDPVTRAWSANQPQPVELHHYQAVEVDGLIYAAGAFTGNCCDEPPVENIYIYDPYDDEWIVGPEIPAQRRRGSAGTVVHERQLYLVSGLQVGHQSGWVPWTDRYDPATNTWQALSNAPRARDHFQAALVNGKIYAAGGRRSGEDGIFNATVGEVDVYDLATGQWSTLANNIPTQRAGTMSALLNNELIIIGGESGGQSEAHPQTEALNLSTNQWRSLALLNEDRHGSQAIVSNGGIYIASGSGGRGGGPELSSLEAFYFAAPTLPAGEPLVEGTLIPALSTVAAGEVMLNATRTAQFSVANSGGNQAIVISALTLAGDSAFTFATPHPLPYVIAPGQSTQLQVTFAPTALQSYSAQLKVAHSGAGGELVIPLSGEGVNTTPSNTAPVVIAPINDFSIDEDSESLTIDLAQVFSDAEESASGLTYSVVVNSNTSLILTAFSTSQLLLSTIPNATGVATIHVRATDSEGLFVDEAFVVTVVNVNDPPSITQVEDDVAISKGQQLTITVSAADPDDDALTFALSTAPVWSSASLTDNGDGTAVLHFMAGSTDDGAYVTTVSVTDPEGLSATTIFTIVVEGQNRSPILSSVGDITIKETEPSTLTVRAVDPDGDVVVIDGVDLPSFVTLTDSGAGEAVVVIKPALGDAGQYTLLLRATDPGGLSAQATVTLTVQAANQPPAWDPVTPQTAVVGQPFGTVVRATDPEGDALTLSLIGKPDGLTFTDLGDGRARLSWTPLTSNVGTYTMIIRATDSAGRAASENLVLSVIASNQPPTLPTIGEVTVNEGSTVTLTVTAMDVDNQFLTFEVENLPPFGTVTEGENGTVQLHFAPNYTQSGLYTSTISVRDPVGESASDVMTIRVIDVNQRPVLAAIEPVTITHGSRLTTTIEATDPDGDELTVTVTGIPPGTTFSEGAKQAGRQTAQLSWSPLAVAGRYTVVVRAEDREGLFTEKAVTVTILLDTQPQAPKPASDTSFALTVNQPMTITIHFVDPNGDAVTLSAVDLPDGAIFTNEGDGTATLFWVPTAEKLGTHTVTIMAVDTSGLRTEQLIQLVVTELPAEAGQEKLFLPITVK